jgi:hypothetical protein
MLDEENWARLESPSMAGVQARLPAEAMARSTRKTTGSARTVMRADAPGLPCAPDRDGYGRPAALNSAIKGALRDERGGGRG